MIDVEDFNLRYGSVRFRLMVFRVLKLEQKSKPTNDKATWNLIYITDFDVSFKQLNKEFSRDLLKDSPVDCKLNTEGLKDKTKYTKVIKDSSFTINTSYATFKTEGTHLASLITDFDLSKDAKFSVFSKKELEIRFHSSKEVFDDSIIDFGIHSMNFKYNSCQATKEGPRFFMKSEEISAKEKSSDEMWKGGKYKILSGLSQGETTLNSFMPFKIGDVNKFVNAILVVNGIPVKRLYDNAFFRLNLEHKFPLKVQPVEEPDDSAIFSNRLKRDNGTWKLVNNKKVTFYQDANYLDKTLYSKRLIGKQPLSLTVHFTCPTRIV